MTSIRSAVTKKVFLTGGTGFVGKLVLEALLQHPALHVVLASRRQVEPRDRVDIFHFEDLADENTDWGVGLTGVDYVIHAAARVHVMNDASGDPLAEYRKVNVGATLALAEAAARAGVKRFIFLSSIKVNGESTEDGQRFTRTDLPRPSDPYGVSKLEAEIGLRAIGNRTGMEITIIRPVLVYGMGVGANFAALMRLAATGLPLPFAKCRNKRSFVYAGNLVDLIVTCLEHPNAADELFLVSDGRDISTEELLRMLMTTLAPSGYLFSLPKSLLDVLLRLIGRGGVAKRLFGSLCVDIRHTQERLDWTPPYTLEDGVRRTADHYKSIKVAAFGREE